MRKLAILGLVLAPLMSASAQTRGPELTVGLASLSAFKYSNCTGCNTTTSFNVGEVSGLALAWYMSAGMAIEPQFSIFYQHSGDVSTTDANIGVGVPFYMKKDWGHTGLYVEPMVGLAYSKVTDHDSQNQFVFGGSVGYKMKVSDHVSTRLSGFINHAMEKKTNDVVTTPGYNDFGAMFAISVFFGGK